MALAKMLASVGLMRVKYSQMGAPRALGAEGSPVRMD
jgi:hypothetical protein